VVKAVLSLKIASTSMPELVGAGLRHMIMVYALLPQIQHVWYGYCLHEQT